MPSQIRIRLKSSRFERWQLLFLLFLVYFATALLYNLAYKSILWDETPHLYGALLLSHGQLSDYLSVTFYPPLFDVVAAGFFAVLGSSLFVGRLVAVVFALLTLGVLFKLASKTYGRKVAFLSCIILATMPGFIWVARLTILETALEFFLVACLFFFVEWLYSGKDTMIFLSGLMLGLAFLTKYQALVAGLVILVCLPILFYRSQLKAKFSRFWLFLVAAGILIVPMLARLLYSGGIGTWISLLQINDAQANIYSTRFSIPIFYLMEITNPGMPFANPVTIGVLVLGLMGLSWFVWRRKPQDKFFLVWFLVVYVFFTLIASRTWRYALPLFPVLAVGASVFVVSLFDKMQDYWKKSGVAVKKKWLSKALAAALIIVVAGTIVYSAVDAEMWVANESTNLPLPEAIRYVAQNLTHNQSLMVLCPVNNLNINVAQFYLAADECKDNSIWQYPTLPPDSYTPNINVAEFTALCHQKNVRYVLLDDNTGYQYFNSTLTAQAVSDIVLASGNFTQAATFGTAPYRVFVFQPNPT
jgi:4-amino-4-deoxy-L-arabinose transferase-like glycosyltransferase